MNWQSESNGSAERAAESAEEAADPADALWTISEVQERAGVSARTLRYYEELGLLPGVRRRAGGRRVYGSDELERLRFIQRLKALGLTLAEVKELNAVYAIGGSTRAMLGRLDQLLRRHSNEVEARIGELVSLRDEIDAYHQHVGHRIDASDGPDDPEGSPR